MTDLSDAHSQANSCSIEDIDGESIIGKLFATADDAHSFYIHYARKKGFGTRISVNSKSITGKIIRRKYVCNKEGKKSLTDKREIGKEIKCRREIRTGCMARMGIALTNTGEWIVDEFNDVHNHTTKHLSHSKGQNCGSQEVNISEEHLSHYLLTERKNYVFRECLEIIKHLQDRSHTDGGFAFSIDIGHDGFLRSVIWADRRSRSSYLQFGDVLAFDMTYRAKQFKLPFASFTGLNHHRQPILFAAAFLEDETERTFVWLFDTLLKCMFQRPPVAIIADQDEAVCNAIKRVFPTTRHCFCTSHVTKSFFEHSHSLRSRYDDFDMAYTKWVESITVEEFEAGWRTLNEKYVIEDESWLTNMYNLRHHWVKAYLKDTFLAGMDKSGQSESIHTFFEGYIDAHIMANDFLNQYDRAIKFRRDAEEDADFRTINSKAVLLTSHSIEVQAGKCYTQTLFEEFKKEWNDAIFGCSHERLSREDSLTKYIVGPHNQDKSMWRIVQYDSSGDTLVTCTCAKFETLGMLCKHMLYIMRKKRFSTIPKHYILRRWTIDARYMAGLYNCGTVDRNEDGDGVTPLMLWSVRAKFYEALEYAKKSPAILQKLDSYLDSFLAELAKKKFANRTVLSGTLGEVGSNATISDVEDMHQISVCDTVALVKTTGCPKIATRKKSELELTEKTKKQRTCGFCGEKGHYRTGCQKRKMAEKEGGSSAVM